MFSFRSTIQKFASKAEKTGWTYVEIPPDIILKLKLKTKKEFRIKGLMDDVKFERLSTYPIGSGNFIIAINAELRKKLGKKEGATLAVTFELDNRGIAISKELMDCLQEDKIALKQFQTLTPSHQGYFHKYVEGAKTQTTKTGRIINTLNALLKKQNFGTMIRGLKK